MLLIFKKIPVLLLFACVSVAFAADSDAVSQLSVENLQPQGLNYTGIYALRQMQPQLNGKGVKVAAICRSITYINGQPQNDYRPATKHNCFKDKQLIFHDQNKFSAGISAHSTAICSILFAEDPNAFNKEIGQFHYQGVLPNAQPQVYEFWHFLIDNVYTNAPPDCDVVTVSIGSHFEDWWTRGIESLAEQYGLIVVAGIGNGRETHDPPLYPGAGANAIGVGVVDSVNTGHLPTDLSQFALAHPEHSSYGPTVEGHCKPDIVAPGNCLAADANNPDTYEPTGNWSSFSTPLVAGTVGLLLQKANEDPNLNDAIDPNGGNCVMKAVLMNSATKLPFWHKGKLTKDDDHQTPLDYLQGAGMLNATAAYRQLTAGINKPGDVSVIGWDLNQTQNPENVYKINTENTEAQFVTVTLVWNKHYQNQYPFEPIPQKDADLRLEIWAIHPNNPDKDILLDYSDSAVDNIEHIHCAVDTNYSNYEIVVLNSDINELNQIKNQRYALAWNADNGQDNYNLPSEDSSISLYDLNMDGIVNEKDFVIVAKNYFTSANSPESPLLGDIDDSGTIDVNDLELILNNNNRQAEWYKH